MPQKRSKQKINEKQEWPVLVYMWALGLGLVGFLVVGESISESRPHPIHWFSGLTAGVLGIGFGWLWCHWRGEVI